VIRVLLADDQALVRGAIAALLQMEDDIIVVAEVADGSEVVEACADSGPDVVLLDVDMPGLDGISATAEVKRRFPEVRVLVVTTFGRPGYVRRALRAGADGFIVKDTPASELAETVRKVASGRRVVDPILAADSALAGESPLTPRECEVLRIALTGATVERIAATLSLSEGTVRNHLSSAIGKTRARTRSEAARIATENGWL
jgi:two-component system response regulator DesR